jgi:hypothetical protein
MKKLMVPLALAFALSATGAAFAATSSDPDAYLYAQPSPFAQPTDSVGSQTVAQTPDPRLDPESQEANLSQQTYAAMPQHQQQASSDPWTQDGIFGPYGPE